MEAGSESKGAHDERSGSVCGWANGDVDQDPRQVADRSNLSFFLQSNACQGVFLPFLEFFVRNGDVAATEQMLEYMVSEARGRARILRRVGPFHVRLGRGVGSGGLRKDLFLLYCKLAAEGLGDAPALKALWAGLEQVAMGCGRRATEQQRVADTVLSLLSGRRALTTRAELAPVLSLVNKAGSGVLPPLLYANTWVSWLGAVGRVWQTLRSSSYPLARPLLTVLLGLQSERGAQAAQKMSKVFFLEMLLLDLLRLLELELGETDKRPGFREACDVVAILNASLLQLRRNELFAILLDAKELLQLSDWTWAAAAVAGHSPVLLKFFLQQAPAPLPQRQLQTLLEMAVAGVYTEDDDDEKEGEGDGGEEEDRGRGWGIKRPYLPQALCLVGLLLQTGASLELDWLQDWGPSFESSHGRWRKLRSSLVQHGLRQPAQLVAYLNEFCDPAWVASLCRSSCDNSEDDEDEDDDDELGGDESNDSFINDDDEYEQEEAQPESDSEEEAQEREPRNYGHHPGCGRCKDCEREREATKRRLAEARQALESVKKELAGTEESGKALRRENMKLEAAAARGRQELQALENKLRDTRTLCKRAKLHLRGLRRKEKKAQAPPQEAAVAPLNAAQGPRDAVPENEEEENDATRAQCAVCLNEPGKETGPLVVFFPCAHARICADCAAQLERCPLCRQEIREFVAPV